MIYDKDNEIDTTENIDDIEEDYELNEFLPTKRRKTHPIRRLILVCLASFAAITLYIYRDTINISNIKSLFLRLDRNIHNIESMQIDFASSSHNSYAVYNGNFALLSTYGLKLFSRNGNTSLDENIIFQNPAMQVNNKVIMTYDRGGNTITAFNSSGIQWQSQTNYPIVCVKVNKNGYFAVITNEKGYRSIVEVYNKNFEKIYVWKFANRYALDVSISPDNSGMVVSAGDADGGEIFTDIVILHFNKEEPISTKRYDGSLFLSVEYKALNTIAAISDNMISFFDANGTEISKFLFNDKPLRSAYTSSPNFNAILLSKDYTGSTCSLIIFDDSGNELSSTDIDEKIEQMAVDQEHIAMLGREKIFLYNREGKYTKTIDVEIDIRQLLLYDGEIVIIGSNRVYSVLID